MSLLKTQFIWDKIELFKFIQFPWRWMSISILFFSLMLASKTWLIKNVVIRSWLVGICVVITAFGAVGFFRPEEYLDDSNDFYYTDPMRIRKELSGILPDYISTDMVEKPTLIPEELVISQHEQEVIVLADRTHEKLIKTNFKTDEKLELAVANYPGWSAKIDDQWWNKEKGEQGNIMINVPSGSHLLSLRFENTPLRNWADLVSLLSWLLFIYLVFPAKKITKKVEIK